MLCFVRFLGRIACIACLDVPWSICPCDMCWSRPTSFAKRINRLKCRFGQTSVGRRNRNQMGCISAHMANTMDRSMHWAAMRCLAAVTVETCNACFQHFRDMIYWLQNTYSHHNYVNERFSQWQFPTGIVSWLNLLRSEQDYAECQWSRQSLRL